LLSLDWEELFLDVSQRRLPRALFDHFPLLLDCGVVRRGSKPFRFESMWLHPEGFEEQVKTWWGSYMYESNPSYVLAQKLKALKVDSKKWNVEVFGDVRKRKEMEVGIGDWIGS
jgi:hypothetical protein